MDENNVNNLIKQYMDSSQYGVTKIPSHLHNGIDTSQIDIKDIKRFPSNPTNGQTVVFNSTTNQWEATTSSSGGINGRSYGTGVTSISSGSETKLTLSTNSFANGVTWDSANHKLIVLTAGQYLITALTTYTNTTDAKGYQTLVHKNGGTIMASNMMASATGGAVSPVCTDIQTLAVNDYLELYTFQNSGGSQTVSSASEQTYLSIAKV